MTFKWRSTAVLASSLVCLAACGGDDAAPGTPNAGSGGAAVLTGGAGATAAAGTGAGVAAAGSGGAPAAIGGSGGAAVAGVGGAAGVAAVGGSGGMLSAGAGGKPSGGTGGGGAGVGAGSGGSAAAGSGGSSGGAFALTSPVVKEGELLPADYRCAKPSPALTWTAGPAGTMSYAIVLKDTTAGVTMGTMHWTIYDIPASVTALPMGVMSGATLTDPAGAKQGKNYQSNNAFTGPCGGMNTYKFTLYALKVATLPGLSASSTGAQVETAAEGANKLASTALNIHSMP